MLLLPLRTPIPFLWSAATNRSFIVVQVPNNWSVLLLWAGYAHDYVKIDGLSCLRTLCFISVYSFYKFRLYVFISWIHLVFLQKCVRTEYAPPFDLYNHRETTTFRNQLDNFLYAYGLLNTSNNRLEQNTRTFILYMLSLSWIKWFQMIGERSKKDGL